MPDALDETVKYISRQILNSRGHKGNYKTLATLASKSQHLRDLTAEALSMVKDLKEGTRQLGEFIRHPNGIVTPERVEWVEHLLRDVHVDPNTTFGQHATGFPIGSFLTEACYTDKQEVVRLLIKYGADVNMTGAQNIGAFMGDALAIACWRSTVDVVNMLLAAGANRLDNALRVAVSSDKVGIVPVLLRAGANVHIREEGLDGSTLLILACTKSVDMCRLLIEAGVDINAKNDNGTTALMYAVMINRLDVVNVLLAAGADTRIKTPDGWTASKLAISYHGVDHPIYLRIREHERNLLVAEIERRRLDRSIQRKVDAVLARQAAEKFRASRPQRKRKR